jgi:hypothetical protein
LNIAPDGSEDSKLSIKGFENGGPEIGDWSQIDNYEDYQELPCADELDEYIKEEECIICNEASSQHPFGSRHMIAMTTATDLPLCVFS